MASGKKRLKKGSDEIPERAMLYKFRSFKYGLLALQERRLLISKLDSLNDPFESMPFDASDDYVRTFMEGSKRSIGKRRGVVSFSWRWSNPVLWSHYAENHQGLCLGFGISLNDEIDRNIFPIRYIGRPLKMSTKYGWDSANGGTKWGGGRGWSLGPDGEVLQEDVQLVSHLTHALLFTKYSHWKYEDEVRVLIDFLQTDHDRHFWPFDKGLRLSQVILGPNCDITNLAAIHEALKTYEHADTVVVTRTKLSYKNFKVEEDTSFRLSDLGELLKKLALQKRPT
jgi:hypothetical protein